MKYFQGTLGTETATGDGFSNHQGCPKGGSKMSASAMFKSGGRRRATSQEGHQGDQMYLFNTVCIFNFQFCTMGTSVMGLVGELHVITTGFRGENVGFENNMLKPQMKQG